MRDSIEAKVLVKRLLLFALLLGWCGVMLAVRSVYSGSFSFSFLVWNLFLATLPAIVATLFVWSGERRSPVALQIAWFGIWLALLPNAPYIVTDFIHLQPRPPVPLWYDVALLASCAGTGLILGYTSLADVQASLARRFSALLGWFVAFVALLLSGFGIYLGRFLRWNTWDALTNPFQLFLDIANRIFHPFSHPRTVAVTIIYGLTLMLGYIALYLLQPGTSREHARTARERGP